jgi:hypothetical protein
LLGARSASVVDDALTCLVVVITGCGGDGGGPTAAAVAAEGGMHAAIKLLGSPVPPVAVGAAALLAVSATAGDGACVHMPPR